MHRLGVGGGQRIHLSVQRELVDLLPYWPMDVMNIISAM